jgi:hypothetical protein
LDTSTTGAAAVADVAAADDADDADDAAPDAVPDDVPLPTVMASILPTSSLIVFTCPSLTVAVQFAT